MTRITIAKVLLFALLGSFTGCGGASKGEKKVEAKRVKTEKATVYDGPQWYTYSGQLATDERSSLSFMVGGMIESLKAQEGDRVEKGRLLARLATVDFENELRLQESRLIQAQDAYQRLGRLYAKKSVPEREFVKAKAGYLSTKTMVDIARKKLADTKLYAPYSGVINQKHGQLGTVVSPGQPIYEITNPSTLKIVVSIPQDEINMVNTGDEIEGKIASLGGKTIAGKVTAILPVADAASRTYRVKATIDQPGPTLKDGMLVSVSLKAKTAPRRLLIPGHAVVMSPDNVPHVFLYDGRQRKALRTRIGLGAVHGDRIEVHSGLDEGDLVIVAGQHKIRDGATVNDTTHE